MIDLLGIFLYLGAGWRFLFSRAFRQKTLARWREESGLHVMQDIVAGAGGVLLSILLPLFAWGQLRGGS